MSDEPKRGKLSLGKRAPSAAGAAGTRIKKANKPKEKQILTLDEAIDQLAALDAAVMTETDRMAAIIEIRARLEEHDGRNDDPAEAMERRLLLLKTWNELVKMRVIAVKNEAPPPFEKPTIERMFVAAEIEPPPQEEIAEPAPEPEKVEVKPVLKPLKPKPVEPVVEEVTAAEEELVSVKLLASETVRGIRLVAGMIVAVQPNDAKNLIQKGKAIVVKG